ncbi:MAG: hypothetical protein CMP85_03985, partial [Gammaproteobacteria bacterium]|nr:hypothetical protein [Gammaproteobacteria bacterium]
RAVTAAPFALPPATRTRARRGEESGGQVLSAKSVRGPDGSQRHRIRVLVDGERVTTVVVDQRGRLLRRR